MNQNHFFKKVTLLIFIVSVPFSLFGAPAFAHQDTIIQLDESGHMKGLPDEYSPAQIDFEKELISIGNTTMQMPPCIFKYFSDRQSYDLKITSSWYHQRSTLPPYISFKVSPLSKDYEYKLLLSLQDLQPIKFEIITHESENSWIHHEIRIGEQCLKALEKSYVTN